MLIQIGPWSSIAYVTSGLTLAAFVVAATVWMLRAKVLERLRLIRTAPEAERGQLIERALEFFSIDTSRLTREQAYRLAIRQIDAREKRFRLTIRIILTVAFLGAGISVLALYKQSTDQGKRDAVKTSQFQVDHDLSRENDESRRKDLLPDAPTTRTERLTGRVSNETGSIHIGGAKVSLEGKGLPLVDYADTEGVFSFVLPEDPSDIKIIVEAEGFLPYNRRLNVSEQREVEDIRLTRNNSGSQPVSPATIEIKTQKNDNTTDHPSPNKLERHTAPKKKPMSLDKRKQLARKYLNSSG